MRTLYDIIYDETYRKHLAWKVGLNVIRKVTKDEFVSILWFTIGQILISSWALLISCRRIGNRKADIYAELLKEAFIHVNNLKLIRNNGKDKRRELLAEWFREFGPQRGVRMDAFALMRIKEEGIDTAGDLFSDILREMTERGDEFVDALADFDTSFIIKELGYG